MRKVSNDEQEIRLWAARYDAHPIERAPYMQDSEPAMLGFVFGDPPEALESLQPISWERFFAMFHLLGLTLAYEDGKGYDLLKIESGPSLGFTEARRMQA